jgi:molecular chaperone GrpE
LMPAGKKIKVQASKKKDPENAPDFSSDEAMDRSETDEKELVPEASEIDRLTSKLEEAEKESKENYDRFLRVSAEFENYRKRAARDQAEFKKFSNESLIRALLPIVDDLERAVQSAGDGSGAIDAIRQGVSLTLENILNVLENFHVEQIRALEQPFDPNFHEAVMQENDAAYPDNTVIRELQKGYLLNGRLLRPAMVVVSRSNGTNPLSETAG